MASIPFSKPGTGSFRGLAPTAITYSFAEISLYKEAQDRIAEIREESDALRDVYGVDADSEEQQYLDLLLKEQAANRPFSQVELTEEESERLYEYRLQGKELTEYQHAQRRECLYHPRARPQR